METIDRFMDKVSPEPNSGCWLWTAYLNRDGYGQFRLDGQKKAHRISYEMYIGPITDGLQIDHLCRVRSCVNPEHLEAVTTQENTKRGDAGKLQRSKTHCPQGHQYSGSNLRTVANGKRQCRECDRIRHLKYYRNKRSQKCQDR